MTLRCRGYLMEGSQSIRVFHGTSLRNAKKIQREGLRASPNMGYESPQWYMVSADFASAAHHSESTDSVRVVVEFQVPTEGKVMPNGRVRKMWEGYPYLWAPSKTSWDGKPTKWWALKQVLDKKFIKKVHKVKNDS